jgi:hypothetical protein
VGATVDPLNTAGTDDDVDGTDDDVDGRGSDDDTNDVDAKGDTVDSGGGPGCAFVAEVSVEVGNGVEGAAARSARSGAVADGVDVATLGGGRRRIWSMGAIVGRFFVGSSSMTRISTSRFVFPCTRRKRSRKFSGVTSWRIK